MKFKNNIKNWLNSLSIALIAGVMATSCTDEIKLGSTEVDLGEKVAGRLSIPMNVPISPVMSRAVDFSPNAILKIDSYWIGIYDTYTKELLGFKYEEEPRKGDGSRFTFNGSSGVFTIEDVDIYYYQNHPEAYIVGVVNFNGITDKDGESLFDLLKNADDWDKFCDLTINTASAEQANKSGDMPIMMGYFTSGVAGSRPTIKGWDNNSITQNNVKARFSEGGDGRVALSAGNVRLMRLISEVTVKVGGMEIMDELSKRYETRAVTVVPSMPEDMQVKIKNLQYKVVNNPKNVYLAERATDIRGADINSNLDVYAKRSANSADFDQEDGYTETGWINVNGNSFTYQFYENKHWGDLSWFNLSELYPDVDDDFFGNIDEDDFFSAPMGALYLREKKMKDYDLFRSLCKDDKHKWNNFAPYFKIRADVEIVMPGSDSHKESATVEYTIHEGFTSDENGMAINMPGYNDYPSYDDYQEALLPIIKKLSLDYQRYRNTQYTYYLAITDFEHLMMQVETSMMGEQMGFDSDIWHNDAFSGSVNEVGFIQLDGEGTLAGENNGPNYIPFSPLRYFASDDLKYRFMVHSLVGEMNYGDWSAEDNRAEGIPALNTGIIKEVPEEILNCFKILVINTEGSGRFQYPEGQGTFTKGELLFEGNIKEFKEYFSTLPSDIPSNYMTALYITEFEAPGVDYAELDQIYRGVYLKMPMYDKDRCSSINSYCVISQTPKDNRIDLSDTGYRPNLDVYEHYPYSRYRWWTTVHNVVNWICWDQTAYSNMNLTVDYYILKVGENGEEIIVNTADYVGYDGKIHYPYYVPSDLPSGANDIWIRPMGFKTRGGAEANYKVTEPFYYTNYSGGTKMGAIYVQTNSKWTFNSGSQFRPAIEDSWSWNTSKNAYVYYSYVYMYGLQINGGSSGLIPYFESGYIQTGGNGGVNNRSFKITVDRPGKVIVNACTTTNIQEGQSSGRGLTLYYYGGDVDNRIQGTLQQEVNQSLGSPKDYEFELPYEINKPVDISIYSYQNLNIYSIEFVPYY